MVWSPVAEPSMSRIDAHWESCAPPKEKSLKDWVKTGVWGMGLPSFLSCLTGTPDRDADDAIGAEESSGSQWGKGLLEFTSSWSTSKKSTKRSPRVAFQGMPETGDEDAAACLCPTAELVPCQTFQDAFQAVDAGDVNQAVLPCEDSANGAVSEVYDCLAKFNNIQIEREFAYEIDHCLVALPGVKLVDVKSVYCYPQAQAHCREYLSSLGAETLLCKSANDSARLIHAKILTNCAAITTQHMAKYFGLDILSSDVQDYGWSAIRYVVVSKAPSPGNDTTARVASVCECKTSLAIGLPTDGRLNSVLSILTANGIEIDNVVSRPSPREQKGNSPRAFSRMFFLDVIGSTSEPLCKLAVHRLQQTAGFLRVLGSYPRDIRI